jgi:methyl-accepting chemotaxis protein
MFNKMKLAVKIGAGFGLIILIAALLGFVGWRGVTQVRSYLDEYALWGDIDMIMNEGVTQNALMLVNDLNVYRSNPNAETLEALNRSMDKADQGITEWAALVEDYPALRKVAEDTKAHLAMTRSVVERVSKSMDSVRNIKEEWDGLVASCLAHLEETMEEAIDPAKEAAENAGDISEMVKWGAIDMVMNEAVIAHVLKLQTAAHDYAAKGDDVGWNRFLSAHKASLDGLSEWRNLLAGEAKMEDAAQKTEDYLRAYGKLGDRFHKELMELQKVKLHTDKGFETLLASLEEAMEKIIDPAKNARIDAASAVQERASLLAVSFTVAGIVLGVALAVLITMGIIRPINRLINGLDDGAAQIESASAQVSSASQSLAGGTSEQAASIEETSSTLEEISAMTKQNAAHATEADHLMKESAKVVRQAEDAMVDLTSSMNEISQASQETQKIVKTINEIAFQTNLLALNAAVEAARAGEAGAGFAVVADEVRNLAMKAADAAKNTARLIEGTVKRIGDGSEVVGQTNEAFSDISAITEKAGNLVGEIAVASTEQAQGIEQINQGVSEMDKVVQENAASAEELASASEELSSQCIETYEMVKNLRALINGSGKQKGLETSRSLETESMEESLDSRTENHRDMCVQPNSGI